MSVNMFIDPMSRQFSFAPPPESLVEDVQITFDTEMIDEEEALALQQQNAGSASMVLHPNGVSTETPQATEMAEMETDMVQINLEKVHLRGVDTMATADIEVWERKWVGEEGGMIRIQWIDDSSCKHIRVIVSLRFLIQVCKVDTGLELENYIVLTIPFLPRLSGTLLQLSRQPYLPRR